ncbi:MAG: hypothetical protein WC654_02410 [Patescibacteria group bacterium]
MTTIPMPVVATCCQCRSTYPVKAIMSLPGGNIPLLVVLPDVSRVEDALAGATCQVCLNKTGSQERGLFAVLTRLGCTEVQARASRLVLPTRHSCASLTVDLRALAVGKETPHGPSMAGARVVLPSAVDLRARLEMPRRGAVRPVPAREPMIDDKPRIMRALQPPDQREPEPKVEPLKVGLDARSIAALEAARPAARVRDEAKRRSRLGKFGARMKKLKHLLLFVREHAALGDVDREIEEYKKILIEAIDFDPKQRGRQGLLSRLGTSEVELEELRIEFFTTHTIVPKKDGGEGGGEDGSQVVQREPMGHVKGVRLAQSEINPFPNGCRPRHFDGKCNEGRQVALLPVMVVQAKSSLPIPNAPLCEPEDPYPKIVYPQGGRYGDDYTVKGSRRKPKPDRIMGKAKVALLVWSADHIESIVSCTNDPVGGVVQSTEIPLVDLMCLYLEPYLEDEEQIVNVSAEAQPVPSTEVQPHTEV